jgi:beta-glucosidase
MVGQSPIYYAHNHTGRAPSGKETLIDDIPVEAGQTSLGCSSFYMDAGFGPLFPFGYGLSYTTFGYDKLNLSADKLRTGETLTASVNITNTGEYAGTEVVQLYIRDKVGSVTRPVKELKGFQRVTLQPGETKTVTFNLPVSDLAYWNIDMKKVVEPGEFTLWLGTNSDEGLSADLEVID